jgi:GT2 family glycosyltransferase
VGVRSAQAIKVADRGPSEAETQTPALRGDIELSVVVPSFNGAERAPVFLPKIVAELEKVPVTGEIVLVDNGSTDATAGIARAVVPTATVVRITPNRGSSGGRNEGARIAQGRWLLLCDDDVELTPGCLRSLWEARDAQACVVPRLHDLRGELQNAITERWSRGDLKFVQHPEPVAGLAYPVSACMLLERHLYWEAGGFDERYQPNGYEDTAFGFALRGRGAALRMVPEAVAVNHIHGETRNLSQHKEEYRSRIYKNRWLFNLLVLQGWRRWAVVVLGLPRTALESVRVGSTGPLVGFVAGCSTYFADRWGAFRQRQSSTG